MFNKSEESMRALVINTSASSEIREISAILLEKKTGRMLKKTNTGEDEY